MATRGVPLAPPRSLFYRLRRVPDQAHIHLPKFGHLRRVGFVCFLGIKRLDLDHVRERSRTKELLPSTKDIFEAPLGEVGYFRREDLETIVSLTERAAYCLETAFRGPLILASKPLSSLLDFLSESCGLTHDGLLVTELARAIVSINSKRFLSHQSWLRLRTLASFELCVGLPEIREKSELLPYPAAILDGRFVVVGMLLVATG